MKSLPVLKTLAAGLLAAMPLWAAAQVDCTAPREDMGAVRDARFRSQLQMLQEAEKIVRANAAFMNPPEPVRMRSSFSIGPHQPSGAYLHVRAYPEKTTVGAMPIWSGRCDVIPQAERVAAAIGQIDVFFNIGVQQMFLHANGVPKFEGMVGGYPRYSGWVVITKDGRLPWIPQTLADRLDAESLKRERALAELKQQIAGLKVPETAVVQKTFLLLRTSDPAGADKYQRAMQELSRDILHQQQAVFPALLAQAEKQLADLSRLRASFSADELQSPAVWADASGDGKRRLDARVRELQQLPADIQRQADDALVQARALERQAQAAQRGGDSLHASALREQAQELSLQARALRQQHRERSVPAIQDAMASFDIENLKPGAKEQAMAFKPDPGLPDMGQPDRVQLIALLFSEDPRRQRGPWMQAAKASFDFAALAALLR